MPRILSKPKIFFLTAELVLLMAVRLISPFWGNCLNYFTTSNQSVNMYIVNVLIPIMYLCSTNRVYSIIKQLTNERVTLKNQPIRDVESVTHTIITVRWPLMMVHSLDQVFKMYVEWSSNMCDSIITIYATLVMILVGPPGSWHAWRLTCYREEKTNIWMGAIARPNSSIFLCVVSDACLD